MGFYRGRSWWTHWPCSEFTDQLPHVSNRLFISRWIQLLTLFCLSALEGKLFYLSFMNLSLGTQNFNALLNNGIQEIFIAGTTTGRVKITNLVLNTTDIITLSSSNNFQYTQLITQDLAQQVNDKFQVAIIVAAEMFVTVIANKAKTGTGDGYLALPLTSTSTKFYLSTYTPFSSVPSMFTIASPYDGTCLELRYYNGSSSYRIQYLTMQQNDVYTGASSTFDYTGVYISSTKPIAVYSAMACAEIPVGVRDCDHIIEQVPPVSEWGQTFIMSSFNGRPWQVGWFIRVVASTKTTVNYTGITYDSNNRNPVTTLLKQVDLDRGNFDEFQVIGNAISPMVVIVRCSSDCLVMQYDPSKELLGANSVTLETYNPDPFMVTVPALNHYTNNIKFSTSQQYVYTAPQPCFDSVTIVAKTSELQYIYLDGSRLDLLSEWTLLFLTELCIALEYFKIFRIEFKKIFKIISEILTKFVKKCN